MTKFRRHVIDSVRGPRPNPDQRIADAFASAKKDIQAILAAALKGATPADQTNLITQSFETIDEINAISANPTEARVIEARDNGKIPLNIADILICAIQEVSAGDQPPISAPSPEKIIADVCAELKQADLDRTRSELDGIAKSSGTRDEKEAMQHERLLKHMNLSKFLDTVTLSPNPEESVTNAYDQGVISLKQAGRLMEALQGRGQHNAPPALDAPGVEPAQAPDPFELPPFLHARQAPSPPPPPPVQPPAPGRRRPPLVPPAPVDVSHHLPPLPSERGDRELTDFYTKYIELSNLRSQVASARSLSDDFLERTPEIDERIAHIMNKRDYLYEMIRQERRALRNDKGRRSNFQTEARVADAEENRKQAWDALQSELRELSETFIVQYIGRAHPHATAEERTDIAGRMLPRIGVSVMEFFKDVAIDSRRVVDTGSVPGAEAHPERLDKNIVQSWFEKVSRWHPAVRIIAGSVAATAVAGGIAVTCPLLLPGAAALIGKIGFGAFVGERVIRASAAALLRTGGELVINAKRNRERETEIDNYKSQLNYSIADSADSNPKWHADPVKRVSLTNWMIERAKTGADQSVCRDAFMRKAIFAFTLGNASAVGLFSAAFDAATLGRPFTLPGEGALRRAVEGAQDHIEGARKGIRLPFGLGEEQSQEPVRPRVRELAPPVDQPPAVPADTGDTTTQDGTDTTTDTDTPDQGNDSDAAAEQDSDAADNNGAAEQQPSKPLKGITAEDLPEELQNELEKRQSVVEPTKVALTVTRQSVSGAAESLVGSPEELRKSQKIAKHAREIMKHIPKEDIYTVGQWSPSDPESVSHITYNKLGLTSEQAKYAMDHSFAYDQKSGKMIPMWKNNLIHPGMKMAAFFDKDGNPHVLFDPGDTNKKWGEWKIGSPSLDTDSETPKKRLKIRNISGADHGERRIRIGRGAGGGGAIDNAPGGTGAGRAGNGADASTDSLGSRRIAGTANASDSMKIEFTEEVNGTVGEGSKKLKVKDIVAFADGKKEGIDPTTIAQLTSLSSGDNASSFKNLADILKSQVQLNKPFGVAETVDAYLNRK